MTKHNRTITPRVLELCQHPRTMAEIEDAFPVAERQLARYAVYKLVQRGLIQNINPGQMGRRKCGRFVVADTAGGSTPRGDGIELARAWGLPC